MYQEPKMLNVPLSLSSSVILHFWRVVRLYYPKQDDITRLKASRSFFAVKMKIQITDSSRIQIFPASKSPKIK
jgi:hypothetical protein